jgi:hypothetical protein
MRSEDEIRTLLRERYGAIVREGRVTDHVQRVGRHLGTAAAGGRGATTRDAGSLVASRRPT